MKVLHVITSLSRTAGGPARSVQGLVAALRRAGTDARVWAINGGEPWVEGVVAVNGDQTADLSSYDLVHLHGLWSPQLHGVAVACRKAGVPYVVAPRGMLEPWSLRQKWLKKRIARFLYQDADLRHAGALHATAESEAEQFRKLGFKNPMIISPNGVNLPSRGTDLVPLPHEGGRVLFVSRMHPKKGVLELVEAWARVKSLRDGRGGPWTCELVYTLNGETEREYEAKVKARVRELGLEGEFVFTGPLDDEAKWDAYRRADLFVLPTYSENFGIVVAEALYAGVPAITTKGTPWGCLAEKFDGVSSGWWIDLPPKDSLEGALRDALALPDDARRAMGEAGRRLVAERFSWDAVTKPMVEGYRLIGKAERP